MQRFHQDFWMNRVYLINPTIHMFRQFYRYCPCTQWKSCLTNRPGFTSFLQCLHHKSRTLACHPSGQCRLLLDSRPDPLPYFFRIPNIYYHRGLGSLLPIDHLEFLYRCRSLCTWNCWLNWHIAHQVRWLTWRSHRYQPFTYWDQVLLYHCNLF